MNTHELSFYELQQVNGGTTEDYNAGQSAGKHIRAAIEGLSDALLKFSKIVNNFLPG